LGLLSWRNFFRGEAWNPFENESTDEHDERPNPVDNSGNAARLPPVRRQAMPSVCASFVSRTKGTRFPVLKPAVIVRTGHKWLGLLVGVQVLIWLVTGLYMVVVNIDFIHGDTLVRNMRQPVVIPDSTQLGMVAIRSHYPESSRIGLQPVMGRTLYTVTTPDGRFLVDPENGSLASPLTQRDAMELARYHYAGEGQISHASLITSDPPMEIQARSLPLWRIDFDDRFSTSFYIDPHDGSLVTRRHRYWRIFDFMWMLHIMDYENRVDTHHPLLVGAQASGLVFALSGIWLLFYSFSGRRRKG
jgi:uncharacterized iron-regulated membrane protein